MAINDPEAIKLCNEVIRPMSELARSLYFRTLDLESVWNAGLSQKFATDADVVKDNREAEGVHKLTAIEVKQVIGILFAMKDQYNTEIMAKPCVRPLMS